MSRGWRNHKDNSNTECAVELVIIYDLFLDSDTKYTIPILSGLKQTTILLHLMILWQGSLRPFFCFLWH